jgi:D-alanyl-D-alanine dipeptidase
MIWDAYRAPTTQYRIFHDYAQQLMQSERLSPEQAEVAAARFVSRPDTVYPHGTGGAVDLTLTVNDEEAFMGTGFDAFEECSAADWYERNPPRSTEEMAAAINRRLLRSAMLLAGFVPYADEWWHYEWGTARWSAGTGRAVVLDRTLSSPATAAAHNTPLRAPA